MSNAAPKTLKSCDLNIGVYDDAGEMGLAIMLTDKEGAVYAAVLSVSGIAKFQQDVENMRLYINAQLVATQPKPDNIH